MSKRLAFVAIFVLLSSMLPVALFGQTTQPFVAITEPTPGASISPTAVTVAGTATAMANTNVVVQALDANGAVLAEIPSPVNAPEGTAGPWQVNLTYSAPVGTSGVIRALLRGADGAVTAQATANVVYDLVPPPPPTSIDILAPVDGMIVSSDQLITVSGTSVSAQNNSIVVRILDAAGVAAGTPRTLGEQATVVDANNNWTVSFQIAPETVPVVMTAVVRSATDGSTMAQDQVQVTLQTAAAPLPPTPVVVAATPPAPLPSEPAAPIIEATPAPPPIVAGPDVVAPPAEVVLPAPTMITVPTVLISNPSPGALVDTADGVTVLGTAQNLLQNHVIVRLRDGFGRTLGEGATMVRADGTWQISLPVQATANMPGTIYAFSSAPVGDRIFADDWVRVVFAGNCSERSDWPVYTVQAGDTLFDIAQATGSTVTELTAANCLAMPGQIEPGQSLYVPLTPVTTSQTPEQAPQVAIDPLPAAEADVTPNQPYTLNGTSSGTAPGSVYVRALDAAGVVLAETHASVVSPPDALGVWRWTAELPPTGARSGSHGHIVAYAWSAREARVVASAVVGARYGQIDEEAFIVISSPPPYSQVDASGMITVTGRGGRLPADKLTVRVVDGSGRILLEQPTSITPSGDTGEGDWITALPLNYTGRGKIAAFSTDEASGSVVAVAVVDVVFGDPSQQDHFVAITYPLPGSVLTSKARLFAVAGYAGGVLPDTVQVLVTDELGDILAAWRPSQVDPVTGFWWLAGPVDVTVEQERTLNVQAIGAANNSGSVAGRDRVDLKVRKTEEVLDGAVYLPEGVTLPEGAIVTVSVRNVSLADAPPEVTLLGEQVITSTLTSPIPFAIVYNPAVVDQNALYSVTARVEDGAGTLLYISTQQTPVITQGNPGTDVQIAAVAPGQ